MSKVCYLIGAGEHYNNIICKPDSDDFVIAVDGGYEYAVNHNITPDLIMGDFDSVSKNPCDNTDIPTITFPAKKDYTDMMLAADKAIENGCDTILIYGGTGGRFDHTIANIQLLSWISNKGARAFLFDKKHTITAITNTTLEIKKNSFDKHNGFMHSSVSGYISIFSLSDVSEGVTINGLKYCTDNATLNRLHALGTSNEFMNRDCEIRVKNGTLLIIAEQ